MEIIMHLPHSASGKDELQKQLAKFHADHAIKKICKLPCPTEQKYELVNTIIQSARQEQLQAERNDIDAAKRNIFEYD